MKKIFTLSMAVIFCFGISNAQQQPFSAKDFNKKSPVEQVKLLNQKGNLDKKFESVPGNSEDFEWQESGSSWLQITTTTYTYNSDGDETDVVVKYHPSNANWYKIHYTYNASGYEIERLIQRGDGSSWADSLKRTITRDGQNRSTEYLNQQYISGNWVNKSRSVYTYNTHSDVTEYRSETWSGTAWATSSGMRYTYTYNPDDTKESCIIELYNSGNWQMFTKSIYTYDAGNVSQTIEQTYSGGNWVNAHKTWNYQYQNYYTTYYETQNWKAGAWHDSIRATTVYDANYYGSVITTEEKFSTGSWQNYSKVSTTYDSYYNYSGFKMEDWDGSAWQTTYESKYIYTYNLANDITEEIYQSWDFISGGLVNEERHLYYNHQHFGSINENASNVSVEVHPNPVADYLNINAKILGDGVITLTDMQGKLIYKENFKSAGLLKTTISVINLSDGLYQLNIYDGKNLNSTKVLVKR